MDDNQKQETDTKMVDKLITGDVYVSKKNKKKILVYLLCLLIVIGVIAMGIIAWWYLAPVATVSGEKITRTEYNQTKFNLEKFYKYNNDKESLKNLSALTKNKLIEEKIIRIEAKKRGIVATEQQINDKYQKLVKEYKNEQEFIQTIKNAYNFTPELTKKSIEIRLLKEALEQEVIKGFDVTEYIVRYDMGTRGFKENPTSKSEIEAAYKLLQSGWSIEKLVSDPKCQPPTCGAFKLSAINQTTASKIFFASKGEDWAAISKLTKVGELTGVVRSSGGYYVIFRADRISSGSYNTWDEFMKDYKSSEVSYNFSTRLLASYRKISTWIIRQLNNRASAASATCTTNGIMGPEDPNSPVRVSGHVKDKITGDPINNVTVNWAISDYNGQCRLQYKGDTYSGNLSDTVDFSSGKGRDNVTTYTNSSGWYDLNGDKSLECHFSWQHSYSKTGYETETGGGVPVGSYIGNASNPTYTSHIMNGQAMTSNVELKPTKNMLTIEIYNNNGSSGKVTTPGENINCSKDGNAAKTGSCQWDYDNDAEPVLTATASKGSFVTWGGDRVSNPALDCKKDDPTATCNVRMGQPRTVTATFNYCDPGETACPTSTPTPTTTPSCTPGETACPTPTDPPPPPDWLLQGNSWSSPTDVEVGDPSSPSFGPGDAMVWFNHNVREVTGNPMDTNLSLWLDDGRGSWSEGPLGGGGSVPKNDFINFTYSTANGTRYCQGIYFSPISRGGGEGLSDPRACVNIYQNHQAKYAVNISVESGYEKGSNGVGSNPNSVDVRASIVLTSDSACRGILGNVTIDRINLSLSGPLQPGAAFPTSETIDVANCLPGGSGTEVGSITWQLQKDPWLNAQPPGPLYYTATGSLVGGSFSTTPISPPSVTNSLAIYEVPYTRFYGNDIYSTGGDIYFNKNMKPGFATGGSAVQYAAIAATGKTKNIFTNVFKALPNNNLGTNWASGAGISYNPYEKVSAKLPETTNLASPILDMTGRSGAFKYDNNLSLSGSPADKSTIYTTAGDIAITSDMFINSALMPANAASISTAPVTLIVSAGDIYIGNIVKQIDAILIAQGTIYTCATGFNRVPSGSLDSQCKNKLVVNGAVGAAKISFLRSIGTRLLGPTNENNTLNGNFLVGSPGSNSEAAEVINFPAYLYFATPLLNDDSKSGFQSIYNAAPLL